jgi:hypothetical protein
MPDKDLSKYKMFTSVRGIYIGVLIMFSDIQEDVIKVHDVNEHG